MPAPCPTEEELLAVAAGARSEPGYEQALAHLEACEMCRLVVSELACDRLGSGQTSFADAAPPDAAAAPTWPGPGVLVAGKYRVGRVMGQGGMGIVLEAQHTLLEERVALKFMHRQIATSPEASARFLQEARASAKIKDEHVARVLDVGSHEGAPYLVMEYLEGRDLASVLADEGALPVELACEYVLQACAAIGRAHASGIVHRDLKPANLFLAEREGAPPILKVLDFGIAKAMGSSGAPSLTASNAFLGSPRYMAPEQVQNARDVDARVDIWALGAVLFELVTGRAAFDQGSVASLMVAICTQPAPPLAALRPDLPVWFARLVADCLQIDPALRPQTIDALKKRLVAAPAAPTAAPRRSHSLWWVGAAILAFGFGVGIRAHRSLERAAPATIGARLQTAAPARLALPESLPQAATAQPAASALAPTPMPSAALAPTQRAGPKKPASHGTKKSVYDSRE